MKEEDGVRFPRGEDGQFYAWVGCYRANRMGELRERTRGELLRAVAESLSARPILLEEPSYWG